MNFALARNIYGTPWSVDSLSATSLTSLLLDLRNGVKLELPEQKYNSIGYLVGSEIRYITSPRQLVSDESDFKGIGVLSIDGPITRKGGESSYGMIQISNMMLSIAKDKRIKGFMLINDSGGGETGAVALMQDTILEVRNQYKKPVYSFIPKGAMSNSAMYGIASVSTGIYSESEMNMVGGTGTLIEIKAAPNGTTDSNGEKTLRIYATKSEKGKNKGFEEAINNDNIEVIQNELLNPINDNFLSRILENRPQLKGSNFEDGKTYFAKDVIGTFIDGIASFDEVVGMLEKESFSTSININPNSKKMTKEEIKSQFPQAHSEIVSEGVTQERERVASWMVYQKADPEMVANGISNGEAITPSQREALMVKMNSNAVIESLKADNPAEITTPESTTEKPEEPKEDEAVTSLYSKIAKSL